MANTIHIEITDNSGKVKEEFEAAVLRALETCGLTAEGYAKLLCPVDTGNLRNSITHQVEPAVYIGTNPIPARAGRAEKARFYAVVCTREYWIGSPGRQAASCLFCRGQL